MGDWNRVNRRYGDIAPTTLSGRAIAIVLMLTGIGLISTSAASITAYFIGQQENVKMAAMKAHLARIEALLVKVQREQVATQRKDTNSEAATR